MSIFQITDYQRDYENAWEWIEGDNHEGTKVNISRTHNWKTGNYERPILISVSAPVLSEEKLSDYALQLANTLKTEVWIGKVDWETQNERDYQFEIKNRVKPVE